MREHLLSMKNFRNFTESQKNRVYALEKLLQNLITKSNRIRLNVKLEFLGANTRSKSAMPSDREGKAFTVHAQIFFYSFFRKTSQGNMLLGDTTASRIRCFYLSSLFSCSVF